MNGVGTAFFRRFLQDSRVRKLYKNFWQDFESNKLNELLQYIDDQAKLIKPSVTRNSELWENTRSFDAMCRGKVEFIEDMEEKRRALDIIMRHYTKDQFSYSDPAVRNVKVWKVPVDQMTGKVFGLRADEKP